ncbi:MAG: extracellular solute-binding protein [Lachnospiraceae bacterium]|nr:extracellular solute-binding protein [Lachnospiraceae bacterium]
MEDFLREFAEQRKDEINLEFTVSVQGEDSCGTQVMSDVKGAADIFCFADDQLNELKNGDALLDLADKKDTLLERFGGEFCVASEAVMREGHMYACPETSGNGYFLYYNKKYFEEKDVEKLDDILKIAAENEKLFSMDIENGWYLYSFFKGAGFNVFADALNGKNLCDWNSTDKEYKGTDVLNALLKITGSEGFVNWDDKEFLRGVREGEVIAGVSGPWNAGIMEEEWGEDYGAAKLPTYTLKGKQIQMCSFTGFKLLGINANTKYPELCMDIVDYITIEKNQIREFETTGEIPANIKARDQEEIDNSVVARALADQSEFSYIQNINNPYWEASRKMGVIIAGGNRDDKDLQEVLDNMVRDTCAYVKE